MAHREDRRAEGKIPYRTRGTIDKIEGLTGLPGSRINRSQVPSEASW